MTTYRALFEECVDLRAERAAAAATLAASEHPDRTDVLIEALFDLADEIDECEASFDKVKPSGGWGTCDQRPSVFRHALAAEQAALEEVLVAHADVTSLIEAYAEAEKADGKKSLVRRVALIDVLGRCGDPDADARLSPLLGAKPTFVRIAAVQALVRPDTAPSSDLQALLRDPSLVVRRALLAEIAGDGAAHAAWVMLVHAVYGTATGQERAECVAALRSLTGAAHGDEPEAWDAFVEQHYDALADGSFVRPAPIEGATAAPIAPAFTFYEAPSTSRAVVFVLDNTTFQTTPADVEVQRTKSYGDWGFGKQGWEKEHDSHRVAQTREFAAAVEGMGDDAGFGAVMNKESASVVTLGERKLLRAGKRGAKKAVDFLDENPPRAFRSELANLVDAMRVAGLSPEELPHIEEPGADTVMMVCDGSLRGGHYVVPEAAVAAFARLNRLRRLVVHTIRICDAGPESERLLRGIAAASGGTYRWAERPPAR